MQTEATNTSTPFRDQDICGTELITDFGFLHYALGENSMRIWQHLVQVRDKSKDGARSGLIWYSIDGIAQNLNMDYWAVHWTFEKLTRCGIMQPIESEDLPERRCKGWRKHKGARKKIVFFRRVFGKFVKFFDAEDNITRCNVYVPRNVLLALKSEKENWGGQRPSAGKFPTELLKQYHRLCNLPLTQTRIAELLLQRNSDLSEKSLLEMLPELRDRLAGSETNARVLGSLDSLSSSADVNQVEDRSRVKQEPLTLKQEPLRLNTIKSNKDYLKASSFQKNLLARNACPKNSTALVEKSNAHSTLSSAIASQSLSDSGRLSPANKELIEEQVQVQVLNEDESSHSHSHSHSIVQDDVQIKDENDSSNPNSQPKILNAECSAQILLAAKSDNENAHQNAQAGSCCNLALKLEHAPAFAKKTRIPPFPGASIIPPVAIPGPTKLSAQASKDDVDILLLAYQSAAEHFSGKSEYVPALLECGRMQRRKMIPGLMACAAQLRRYDIAPISWAYWSIKLWREVIKPTNKTRPAIKWVFSAARVSKNHRWFSEQIDDLVVPRTVFAPSAIDLIRRWQAMIQEIATCYRPDVDGVIAKWFPNGYESFLEKAKSDSLKMRETIKSRIDRGVWLW